MTWRFEGFQRCLPLVRVMRLVRLPGFAAALCALLACGVVDQAAGASRAALIVGNGAYRHVPPLKNPANDARDLAAKLRENGFEVEEVIDANLKAFEQAIERFLARLGPDAEALFHFSGHGMQIEEENYLIPVDFEMKDPASVKYDAISAGKLHDRMAGSGARLNIVILDACRNNGFAASRSSGAGLAAMNAARGSFIAFSTAPGRTASDDPMGRNGLFTGYLLEALSRPGLSLDEVFNYVRERTYEASEGKQLPWTSSSVIGPFFFAGAGDRRDLVYSPNETSAQQTALQASPRQAESRPAPQANLAGLGELDERLTQLASRAAAVQESLRMLRDRQQQQGLGLRGDIVTAQNQMEFTLSQAEAQLGKRDAAATQRSLRLAEQAIETLEKFLGR